MVGLEFLVVPSQADEALLENETPREHVLRLSRAKAMNVANRQHQEGRWFIGSDTVVICDQIVMGKPADHAEARAMLQCLSGRSHEVLTGYAVHDRQSGKTLCDAVTTRVFFKALTAGEIESYIATGEPFDKAGAYAIQGIGMFMIPRIEGSYTNVVGLPLCEVLAGLDVLGAIPKSDFPRLQP